MERSKQGSSAYRAGKTNPVWYWAAIAAFIVFLLLSISKRSRSDDTGQGADPVVGQAEGSGARTYGLSENEALLTDVELAVMVAAEDQDSPGALQSDVTADARRSNAVVVTGADQGRKLPSTEATSGVGSASPPVSSGAEDGPRRKSLLDQLREVPQGRSAFVPARSKPVIGRAAGTSGASIPKPGQTLDTVEPRPATPGEATVPESGYWLQAGAFRTMALAETRRARIDGLRLSSRVQPAQINGSTLYRVRLGPYTAVGDVDAVKRRLADGGIASLAVSMPEASGQPRMRPGPRPQPVVPVAAATDLVQKPPSSPARGNAQPVNPMRLVQAGAFRFVEQAEAHRARIALLGLPARIEPVDVDGQILHRVRLGPYRSDAEVDDIRRKLASAGVTSTVMARNQPVPTADGEVEKQ